EGVLDIPEDHPPVPYGHDPARRPQLQHLIEPVDVGIRPAAQAALHVKPDRQLVRTEIFPQGLVDHPVAEQVAAFIQPAVGHKPLGDYELGIIQVLCIRVPEESKGVVEPDIGAVLHDDAVLGGGADDHPEFIPLPPTTGTTTLEPADLGRYEAEDEAGAYSLGQQGANLDALGQLVVDERLHGGCPQEGQFVALHAGV